MNQPIQEVATEKIWLVGNLDKFLLNNGLSPILSDTVSFLIIFSSLLLLIATIDYIASRILLNQLHNIAERTESKWDDYLVERHFFRRLLRFLISIIFIFLIEFFFQGFEERFISFLIGLNKCLATFYFVRTANAFLDASNDIYLSIPKSKVKSIKGYIQTTKIIITILSILVCISIIFKVRMDTIFVSLGTSVAVLSFVFKDTLLGFIASIQLSAQDMVRLGDWIEMPSKGADGVVEDITVNTVKVKNWNNTFTMIPIYSMVSEAFINWRGMEEGDGRRFKRPFYIDLNSIKTFSEENIDALNDNPIFSPYLEKMRPIMISFGEKSTSNVSIYRAYLECYLKSNDKINQDLTLLVRYLPLGDNGLPLEIYGFTKQKSWAEYERAVSEITEHISMASTHLSLRLYQRSSNTMPVPLTEKA